MFCKDTNTSKNRQEIQLLLEIFKNTNIYH